MAGLAVVALGLTVGVLSGCRTASCDCSCGACSHPQARPICTPEEIREGFVPLFNGRDFEGWDVSTNGGYSVLSGGVLFSGHETVDHVSEK